MNESVIGSSRASASCRVTRGTRAHAVRVGHAVEIVAHQQIGIVRCVDRALRLRAQDRAHEDCCEVVGVDVIREDVLVGDERRRAPFDACKRQPVGGVNSRNPHDGHAPAAAHGRAPQLRFGGYAPLRARILGTHGPRLVDERAAAVAVDARRARVDEPDGRPAAGCRERCVGYVGYNMRSFDGRLRVRRCGPEACAKPCAPGAMRRHRTGCAARDAAPARGQCRDQCLRPAVVVALFLRRREMQHGRRQARKPSEAAHGRRDRRRSVSCPPRAVRRRARDGS